MDETQVNEDVVNAVLAASRTLVAVSARSIAGAGGITLPQFRMLVVLEDGPTNLVTLAASLDVAPSTAMRMVGRLVSVGLVERGSHPDDRRQIVLGLTPTGRRTVSAAVRRRRRDIEAIIQAVPERRRRSVARALAEFATAAATTGLMTH